MANEKQNFLDYYQQYKDKIFNYFWYRVGFNRSLAEDLTSEVFLKAIKNFEDFDQTRSFQSWIYAIAKNHLLNHYRVSNREVELLLAEDLKIDELSKVDNRLELEKIFKMINQLSSSYREILLMRFLDGLDNKEITEILGKEEGAVRTQISRAMDELRQKIKQQYG